MVCTAPLPGRVPATFLPPPAKPEAPDVPTGEISVLWLYTNIFLAKEIVFTDFYCWQPTWLRCCGATPWDVLAVTTFPLTQEEEEEEKEEDGCSRRTSGGR